MRDEGHNDSGIRGPPVADNDPIGADDGESVGIRAWACNIWDGLRVWNGSGSSHEGSQSVVVTPNGSRYHRLGGRCGYKPEGDRRGLDVFNSPEEAEAEGYSPCKVCMILRAEDHDYGGEE